MSAVDLSPDAPRLGGLPVTLGFAAALAALLTAVVPTNEELVALARDAAPDAYSIAYLDVLTRATPDDVPLRVVQARHLHAVGRDEHALAVLAPLARAQVLGEEGRELHLDLLLARARALPVGTDREVAFEAVHDVLRARLGAELEPAEVSRAAGLALELEDPELAADLYLKLADADGAERPRALASAARWRAASGDAAAAARLYRMAASAEADPARAIDAALLAVAALEASDRVEDAADLATAYAHLYPSNAQALGTATRLATACNRSELARDLGRAWRAVRPDDQELMRAQVQRELAAGELRAALRLLEALVARAPHDADLRYQRATVAEWAGDLGTAKRDLAWLVAQGPGRGGGR